MRVAMLVLGVLLAGCAQLPFGGVREQGSADAFELQGRVYVRYGPSAFSGSLRWRHDTLTDEVWLGGPLGQTGAHILRDATGATLTTPGQQTYQSTSIEALTRKGLGWALPLGDLSYYVLGKVPPDTEGTAERDAQGRLAGVRRDGWNVRWVAPEDAKASAKRVDLAKEDVEIRLVIDRLEQGAM
ncbi:MAG: outer membrane lipoprotein LolB [Burkholderiales bacterium]|nr:outer membrane lipoprotein LolB [Burkholderiales bacterium]